MGSSPTTGGPSRRWPGWTAWPNASCPPILGWRSWRPRRRRRCWSSPSRSSRRRSARRCATTPARPPWPPTPCCARGWPRQATAGAPTPATLQALLREAADSLRANPKDERLYRALAATFFQPAATQELAAERLGLPFSTYRYHLAGGIRRLTERLWQRELYGPED